MNGSFPMDPDTIRQAISFSQAEKAMIERFALPAETFVPLLLSLRTGGDWSYTSEIVRAIAIMDKRTVYDEEHQKGYTREEIFLIVNPTVLESEGVVTRLEKCGEEEVRMLVKRPYRVKVRGNPILRAIVEPIEQVIRVNLLPGGQVSFTGSSAYGVAHEMEHMENQDIAGIPLYAFQYRWD